MRNDSTALVCPRAVDHKTPEDVVYIMYIDQVG